MTKVLLVKCSDAWDRKKSSHVLCPPLGLLYVVACARAFAKGDYDFKVANVEMLDGGEAELRAIIKDYAPGVVGLSAVTAEAQNAARWAAFVKSNFPDAKVILGGPHVTMYPDAMRNPDFDYGIRGEGFLSAPALLDAIVQGADVSQVPGLVAAKRDGTLVMNEERAVENLDDLPFPAWDAIDANPYSQRSNFSLFYAHGRRYASAITSLGCPYSCAFCHRIFGKKARLMSADRVLRNFFWLKEAFGAKEIVIVDDIFNIDRKRMLEIFEGLISAGSPLALSFPNAIRGDIMDDRSIEAMARAGTYYCMVSIETASERLQKLISKNLDVAKTVKTLEKMDAEGIITGSFFMLGLPGETEEEMLATIELAKHPALDYPRFFAAIPQPGTKMRELAEKLGKAPVEKGFSDYFYSKPSINCSALSDERFAQIYEMAQAVTAEKMNAKKLADKMRRFGLSVMADDEHVRDAKTPLRAGGVKRAEGEIEIKEFSKFLDKAEALFIKMKEKGARAAGFVISETRRGAKELDVSLASDAGESLEVKFLKRDDDAPSFYKGRVFDLAVGGKTALGGARKAAAEALRKLAEKIEQ